MKIGRRSFVWGVRTYVMGIVNVTPDSFSGDGLLDQPSAAAQTERPWIQQAIEQARQFVAAGADLLDVGGESTRPNAEPVSVEEELARVLPVVSSLAAEFDVPISIDTYKAQVAEAALEAGANLVNDVWGLHADREMAAVAARWHVPVVLMHNRSTWAPVDIRDRLQGLHVGEPYGNLLEDVRQELLESVALARAAGIQDEHIVLDPGIGFGKTTAQNRELINRLDQIRLLGYPVLLGPSRKSFIGNTLDLPPDQRLEGTAASIAIGIDRGADIIRVHDVQAMVRITRMTDAIVR